MSDRVTVSLTNRTRDALDHLTAETGLSRTDVVNRAVQMYAFIEGAMNNGAKVIVEWPGGDTDRVKFL